MKAEVPDLVFSFIRHQSIVKQTNPTRVGPLAQAATLVPLTNFLLATSSHLPEAVVDK